MNENQMEQVLRQLSKSRREDVPASFASGIDATLAELPNLSKPFPMKKKRSGIVTAACILLGVTLILGSGFVSPTMAQVLKNLPYIGSIFGFIGDSGIKSANKQGFTTSLNQSVSDQGINVTVHETYYDRVNLSIGFFVTFPQGTEGFNHIEKLSYEAKGKSYSRTFTEEDIRKYADMDWRYVGNDTYYGAFKPFYFEELPEEFELRLLIQQIGGVEGKWNFTIPLQRKETDAVTKIDEPLVTGEWEEYTITLKQVLRTPSAARLIFSVKGGERFNRLTEEEKSYQLHLLSTKMKVFDDKGKPLSNITSVRGDINGGMLGEGVIVRDYHPISTEATSLTVKVENQVLLQAALKE